MCKYSIILLILLLSCTPVKRTIIYEPVDINDGWEISSLENEGLNPAVINELLHKIQTGQFKNLHSLLIAKNGKLVSESYFNGYSREKKHLLKSLGKSITSALIGIAIDQGIIADVNERVLDFFPELSKRISDTRKQNITIKNLLTMASGLDCGVSDKENKCIKDVLIPPGIVEKYFNLTASFEPGTYWMYNDANVVVSEKIIEAASGLSIDEFEYHYLDSLLQIESGGNSTEWKPRDMLKLGQLYLNEGKWKDKQIISSEWIRKSVRTQIHAQNSKWGTYYGYFWWNRIFQTEERKIKSFYAFGNGGQFIFVCPDLNLTVVFTGGNFDDNILMTQPIRIMERYILEAVISSEKVQLPN
ncbi:MAG: beta-lactamase family protein [Melioribacteraceae bacterium]|nr:beta-lactamase family protein [Melioribacteraceae bacterium]MCF8353637.1 beta-lactamase family protein [Melioribacteraceae bacterium]MCF8393407.1 beta-lactamase family protein [Melioribacteraceae bacterium]MCF8419264.1 beta-lactamase family protein [Melioribacteraceae bacterium]